MNYRRDGSMVVTNLSKLKELTDEIAIKVDKEEEKTIFKTLAFIFDEISRSIMIIDSNAILVYYNQPFLRMVQKNEKVLTLQEGLPYWEAVWGVKDKPEDTTNPINILSGERAIQRKAKSAGSGIEYYCTYIPIKNNGTSGVLIIAKELPNA